MPEDIPGTISEDIPVQIPTSLFSKFLSNEIARAVARMVLFLLLALAFIGTKKVLSGAIHRVIPVEQNALIGVFDAIAEFALVAAAVIVTCCGIFEIGWVAVKGTWESTVGAKPKKRAGNDES